MDNKMVSLEEKEIRGMTFKLLRSVILAVASVVITVMFTYYSLKASISTVNMQNTGDIKLLDLRIQTIQIQIDNLKTQVDWNTKTIDKDEKSSRYPR